MAENGERYLWQFRPAYSRLHLDRDLRWVVPFSVRYVIAVVGERFAGKSATLSYLSDARGFRTYSLTDQLRTEATRRGMALEPRAVLRDLGDELRAAHADPALLARLTLRRIHRDHQVHHPLPGSRQRIAVGGFKRAEELELFELLGEDVEVVAIRASEQHRYDRARTSGILAHELSSIVTATGKVPRVDRPSFRRHIDRYDLTGSNSPWTQDYGQAVAALLERPGMRHVSNDHSLKELHAQIDHIVDDLDRRHRTPGA